MVKTVFAVLLSFVVVAAAPSKASPVFKVSKDGDHFYLGGTIHLLSKVDYPLPSAFDEAFKATNTLILETDLTKMASPHAQHLLAKSFFYPHQKTVKDYVLPATYARFKKSAHASNLPLPQLERLRVGPMMAQVVVTKLHELGIGSEGVDAHYLAKSKQLNKHRVQFLESIDTQISVMAGLGKGQEELYLSLALDDLDQLASVFKDMITQWRTWQPDKLDAHSLKPMRDKFPTAYQALVVDRNNRWMATLDQLIDNGQSELVLVGALHLVGDDSLIAKLTQRGYTIEQVASN